MRVTKEKSKEIFDKKIEEMPTRINENLKKVGYRCRELSCDCDGCPIKSVCVHQKFRAMEEVFNFNLVAEDDISFKDLAFGDIFCFKHRNRQNPPPYVKVNENTAWALSEFNHSPKYAVYDIGEDEECVRFVADYNWEWYIVELGKMTTSFRSTFTESEAESMKCSNSKEESN